MSYWDRLEQVADYLEGKTDIYNGKHNEVINTWNNAWDEMAYQGFAPDKASGVRKYIEANKC